MDLHLMTEFFKWCSIINGSFLIFWFIVNMFIPNVAYKTQSYWFPLERKQFDVIIYCFLGIYKINFLFFNLIPWIVCSIIK